MYMQWPIIRIVSGLLLLFLGRRLFWLFVGLVGFFAGLTFAARFFSEQSGMELLLIAAGCGIVGVLLAFCLQKLAIAVAGFLAGGLFATNLLESAAMQVPPLVPFLIGGIIGAILLLTIFDWALILLSSVTGATLLSRALPLEPLLML